MLGDGTIQFSSAEENTMKIKVKGSHHLIKLSHVLITSSLTKNKTIETIKNAIENNSRIPPIVFLTSSKHPMYPLYEYWLLQIPNFTGFNKT